MSKKSIHSQSEKEFSMLHANEWKLGKEGVSYLDSHTRISIKVETSSLSLASICALDEYDHEKSDQELVADFFAPLDEQFSAHTLSLFTTAFGERLIAWGKKVGSDQSMGLVYETLDRLSEIATSNTSANEALLTVLKNSKDK